MPFISCITLVLILSLSAGTLGAEDRVITYGLVPDSPPTTFVDENNTPTGFYIELFSRIMGELGYTPEFVVAPFPELYEGILENEIDLFSSLVRTEKREGFIYWPSEPTAVGWGQFFLNAGTEISGISDLETKDIAIVNGDANGTNFIQYMSTLEIDFQPVFYQTFEDLKNAVESAQVFGGVASNLFLLSNPQFQGTGIVFAPSSSYTTCALTNTEMIPIVDALSTRLRTLKEDPKSYYWKLYDTWISSERIEKRVFPPWVIWVLGFLILLVLSAYLFIQALRHQVEARTGELSVLNNNLEKLVEERTKDLKNAHSQLINAERTALTTRLVAGVAHQINTPLGIAITSTSFIKTELEQAAAAAQDSIPGLDFSNLEQALVLVENSLAKAVNLVRNFRNLSSSNLSTDPSLIQVDEFIPDFISNLEMEFRKAGCRYELDLDPVLIQATPMALSIIIAQLVSNALWHGYGDRTGTVVIRAKAKDENLLLSVEDKGRGISAADLPRIFDPFFSTDRSGERSGLGLNIVKNTVVDVLGGTVEAFSTAGKATRMVVTIPRSG